MIMHEKYKLIQELDASRQVMRSVIAGIDLTQELYPGWTLKHFLAHLTGWDEATAVSLRHHAAGREPGTPAYRGIDDYNAQSVATRETLDYRHVVLEWEHARRELKAAIVDLSPEKYAEELVYPWGARGTVKIIVTVMFEHEHEHAQEISRLLKEKTDAVIKNS
jgi:hypothetical protein